MQNNPKQTEYDPIEMQNDGEKTQTTKMMLLK